MSLQFVDLLADRDSFLQTQYVASIKAKKEKKTLHLNGVQLFLGHVFGSTGKDQNVLFCALTLWSPNHGTIIPLLTIVNGLKVIHNSGRV